MRTLVGYAALFRKPAVIAGLFTEQIARGAFAEAIRKGDCRCLLNHDSNWLLGRQNAGTLRLTEDSVGLKFEVDLDPENAQHGIVKAAISRGDLTGCSFSFDVARDGEAWSHTASGEPIRTIVKVAKLYDVGPVAFPAYEATSIAVRGGAHPSVESSYRRLLTAIA